MHLLVRLDPVVAQGWSDEDIVPPPGTPLFRPATRRDMWPRSDE